MPSYVNNPFVPPQFVQQGVNCYLFGSYNDKQANTKMWVTNVALTSNVATITVQIIEGEIPLVGAYISVIQTASTSGLFNVNRAIITAVTINSATGAGTITYALTHADVTSAADAGTAIAEVPEVAETLANGNSVACCLQSPDCDSQKTVPYSILFPGGIPTAAVVDLQAALRNVDSEFTKVQNAATVTGSEYTAGPFGQATLQRGYFYRFAVSGVSGSTTIVAKIGG
jgi:hypothetical protein